MIAVWIPVIVVSRSLATVALDTFVTDVSSMIRNWPAHSVTRPRQPRRRLKPDLTHLVSDQLHRATSDTPPNGPVPGSDGGVNTELKPKQVCTLCRAGALLLASCETRSAARWTVAAADEPGSPPISRARIRGKAGFRAGAHDDGGPTTWRFSQPATSGALGGGDLLRGQSGRLRACWRASNRQETVVPLEPPSQCRKAAAQLRGAASPCLRAAAWWASAAGSVVRASRG